VREGEPEAAVPGQLPGAGQNQVAQPRKAREGPRAGAQRDTEARDLGKPAGQQRRARVVAELEAVSDPGGDRHHVLEGTA